jgi:hypothetical protein
MRRSISAMACLVAVVLLCASPAMADGQEGGAHSNVVQAVNSDPTNPVVRTRSVVAFDSGPNVTDTNIAFARSHDCTGCRTVAVAVQVVVVEGTPSNYQPQNAAVSVNENCQSCQTFAYAHQYVIQTSHDYGYQDDGNDQLWSIQSQIWRVAHSGEDFATMSSQLDQLSTEYYNAVYQSVQNRGDSPQGSGEFRDVKEQD